MSFVKAIVIRHARYTVEHGMVVLRCEAWSPVTSDTQHLMVKTFHYPASFGRSLDVLKRRIDAYCGKSSLTPIVWKAR